MLACSRASAESAEALQCSAPRPRSTHLCLRELHLVHALARVPVQEGLASEHGRELLADALEHLLDGRGVADERRRTS